MRWARRPAVLAAGTIGIASLAVVWFGAPALTMPIVLWIGALTVIAVVLLLSRARPRAAANGAVSRVGDAGANAIAGPTEDPLQLVLRASQAGVWDWNLTDGTLSVSGRFKEILGAAPDAEPGQAFFDGELLHGADRVRILGALERHFASDAPFDHEFRVRHASGEFVWVYARGQSRRDIAGKPTRFVGSLIDVSDRKDAERELSARERHYRQLVETSESLIWTVDVHGRLAFVNRRGARAVLGYEPGEMIGRPFLDFSAADSPERAQARFEEMFTTQGLTTTESCWRHKDGRIVTLSVSAAVTRDSTGRPLAVVGTAIDVTERVERERALQEANRLALAATQAKSAFLATMSHEIRTPLNGVIVSTTLLAGTNLSPEQQEHVDVIRTSGESLLAIIDDILDLSKIEAGKIELEAVAFDLTRPLDDVLDVLGERVRQKGLELICQIDADVPRHVVGDAARFRQIVLNLVANAVKFTQQGEIVVTVRCRHRDGASMLAEVAVRDTGIGIPADRIGQLFQPFAQADSSMTRRFGGTGLGLAICKRLAGLMGGEIGAESVEGQGSRFAFTARFALGNGPAPSRYPALAGKRCLLVHPNAAVRRVIAGWCAQWGMETRAAEKAQRVREWLRNGGTPDVVVISVGKDLSEEALVGELHALGLPRAVPILLLAMRRRSAASTNAATRSVKKPVKPEVLARALVAALNGEDTAAVSASTASQRRSFADHIPRVLVVEDLETNQFLARKMLERLGCEVDIADTGHEAIAKVATGNYGLVFMDLQMPDLDGLEATRAIRAGPPATRDVPIVAMTASALPEHRIRSLAAGMNDYLTKPLSGDLLESMVARYAFGQGDDAARGATAMPRESDTGANPATAVEPRSLPLLDEQRLSDIGRLEEVAPGQLAHLIAIYAREAPRRLAAARAAFSIADFAALTEAAHAVKGASLNLGAKRAGELARVLERGGQAHDAQVFLDSIDALEQAVRESIEALNQRVQAPNIASAAS
jgi:two-component system sensor histidine kinase/response regulator